MHVPEQILRPKTPEEAAALLEKMGDDAGLLWLGGRVEPPGSWARSAMIDVSALGLDTISIADDAVVIGSATPIQRLVEHEALGAAFGGLVSTAARRVAHYGLRNLASVGGALTSRAGPPELTLALLALDSLAVFVGAESELVPLDALWSDGEHLGRRLLKELRVPRKAAGKRGWGLEWLARSPMDQALVAACAYVEIGDGKVASCRLAVAGLGLAPQRCSPAEDLLVGRSTADGAPEELRTVVGDAVEPKAEFRASAGYQKEMIARLAVRAVAAAFNRAGEA